MKGLVGGGYEPSLVAVFSVPAFLMLFLFIVWLVYRRQDKKRYEAYESLPFEDSEDGFVVTSKSAGGEKGADGK